MICPMLHHVGLVAQVLRFMKSFSRTNAIPSSRLASSIVNVGVEHCGINQRGTSQNVSPVLVTQTHFLPIFILSKGFRWLYVAFPFVTRMTLTFRFRQQHVAISVCGKGNDNEDDMICVCITIESPGTDKKHAVEH